MNNQHRKTLTAIFGRPVPKNIVFGQIENLMTALGCEIIERGGSCIAFKKGDLRLDMHRPHPAKEAKPYQVRAVKEFLENLGVKL